MFKQSAEARKNKVNSSRIQKARSKSGLSRVHIIKLNYLRRRVIQTAPPKKNRMSGKPPKEATLIASDRFGVKFNFVSVVDLGRREMRSSSSDNQANIF